MKKFVKILFKKLNKRRSETYLINFLIYPYSPFRGLGGNEKAHPVSQMSLNILSHGVCDLIFANFTLTYLFPPSAGLELAPSYN